MVDCFAEVRNRVPAIEVAKFYGMEFDKSGRKARCIFHSPDNHPSMSFYNGGFHCWACEEHGSSIDLVQQLYSVSAIGAVRLINSDFHLELKIDGKLSKEDYLALRKREKLVDEHRKFEAWREFFRELPVQMVQVRNLNVDPDAFLDIMPEAEGKLPPDGAEEAGR